MNGVKQIFVRIYKHVEYNLFGSEYIFNRIYRNNDWGGVESVSGPGSDLNETKVIISELSNIFKHMKISTVLDIPCGDFNWMRKVDFNNIQYIGGDIVKELIQQNRVNYEEENIHFRHLNLVEDDLPKVDLIVCRDCLVHFSYKDIFSALKNICRSKSTYLLTTTYTARQNDYDIVTSQWHPINLVKIPFTLPDPIRLINEDSKFANGRFTDKSLGLWEIKDIDSTFQLTQ